MIWQFMNGIMYNFWGKNEMRKEKRRTTSSTTSMAGREERRAAMPILRQRVRSCLASSCRWSGRLGSTPAPPCTAIAQPRPIYKLLRILDSESDTVWRRLESCTRNWRTKARLEGSLFPHTEMGKWANGIYRGSCPGTELKVHN